jgi:hypothetical protein
MDKAASSNAGAICLQGPHQGAQKSTTTGISEFAMKVPSLSASTETGLESRSDFLQEPQFAFA